MYNNGVLNVPEPSALAVTLADKLLPLPMVYVIVDTLLGSKPASCIVVILPLQTATV